MLQRHLLEPLVAGNDVNPAPVRGRRWQSRRQGQDPSRATRVWVCPSTERACPEIFLPRSEQTKTTRIAPVPQAPSGPSRRPAPSRPPAASPWRWHGRYRWLRRRRWRACRSGRVSRVCSRPGLSFTGEEGVDVPPVRLRGILPEGLSGGRMPFWRRQRQARLKHSARTSGDCCLMIRII